MNSIDQSAVAAILDHLPDTRHVAGVRCRDGSVEPFAPEKLGRTFSEAFKSAGTFDEVLLAQCTHDALARIGSSFGGEVLPSADDVSSIVAAVLIEHDLLFAARAQLSSSLPESAKDFAVSAGSGKGLRFNRRNTLVGELTATSQSSTDAKRLADWGRDGGYFSTIDDAASFEAELAFLLNARLLQLAEGFFEAADGHAAPAFLLTDEWLPGSAQDRKPDASAKLRAAAESTFISGNVLLRFEGASRRWHPCPNSGSAAMLWPQRAAILDLPSFCRSGRADVAGIEHAVDVAVTAMDIAIGRVSCPTPSAERRILDFRVISLGLGNLSAALEFFQMAADTESGRHLASALAALCTGRAHAQSARIAASLGPCRAYRLNERPFLKVIGLHRDRTYAIAHQSITEELLTACRSAWDQALELGMGAGFRNAKVTAITDDSALDMRFAAALQPFVSDVATATVSLPATASAQDVEDLIKEAWKLGLKEMRFTRDAAASTPNEPMVAAPIAFTATPSVARDETQNPAPVVAKMATRVELQENECQSITHHFSLGGHSGVLIVGLNTNGQPVELFVRLSKGGPMITGLLDAFAASTSAALRHGMSLQALVDVHSEAQFVPSGSTNHPHVTQACSVADYVARWLAWRFR